MKDELIKFGFKEKICPFKGLPCFVFGQYVVPHISNNDGSVMLDDKFRYYPTTQTIHEYEFGLPQKQVFAFNEICKYVDNATYYKKLNDPIEWAT